jgi:hypothetical protein
MIFQSQVARPSTVRTALQPQTDRRLQRKCACGRTPGPTGECEQCKRKRLRAQRQTIAPQKREPGRAPLMSAARCGHDFSQIPLLAGGPCKALGEEPEEIGEEKPRPTAGSASIQCDGKGGYEIKYGNWATATCGTKDCVTAHESSHMKDWKAKWPNGCKDQAKGYLPKGDPPDDPLMTVAEYTAFLKQSECDAHTADLACANALKPETDACKKTVTDYIKLTEEQRKKWC